MSYKKIASLAGQFAALLVARNISPGERVLLWAENSGEWIAALYGCMLRGVLVVPLDAYGTPEFAGRVAADVRPALVVGDAALLKALPGDWNRLSLDEWPAALPREEAGPVEGLSRETPLQILFTSGTTGEPKGVVHTHGNVLASMEPIEEGARTYLRYERPFHPLRFLHTLPLSHVFGQTMGLWVPPIFGAEVHFENRPAAARMIATIKRERISVVAGVPRVLSMLKGYLESEYPALAGQVAAAQKAAGDSGKGEIRGSTMAKIRLGLLSWWRFRRIHLDFGLKFWAFVTGGGALPGPVEQFWNSLGFVLVQGYGMTETAALITLNHPFHVARGSIGKPLPGREIKLGPDGEVLVRGPMISPATWSGGALHARQGEWLATGDLATSEEDGGLRFLGRKSSVIVTGTGVNIHPEDLEAALEAQPEIAACAVVAEETSSGPEPCAVLAMRGSADKAGAVIRRANERLADFQHIRRWVLWPEPDLPRTSTGKVKRAAVAAWLATRQHVEGEPAAARATDWLLTLVAGIRGEALPADATESESAREKLRLEEDFHLDSLDRVQLFAALEERMDAPLNQEEYAGIETLGALRSWLEQDSSPTTERERKTATNQQMAATSEVVEAQFEPASPDSSAEDARLAEPLDAEFAPDSREQSDTPPAPRPVRGPKVRFVYPRWPWLWPFRWIRIGFIECVVRPLVWLLAAPRYSRSKSPLPSAEPMLIIANHVSAYDVPLLVTALPRAIRDRIAVAMSGEMLEDFRHARNMHPAILNPLGPAAWLSATLLMNVFPLPRLRDFQRSFAHAGEAMDHGYHVIVFPEGKRSPEGVMDKFRPGIGLLVKQSYAAVLPMALVGLGELKTRKKSWFRSGSIEIRVGEPVHFGLEESEASITARLQAEVEGLIRRAK